MSSIKMDDKGVGPLLESGQCSPVIECIISDDGNGQTPDFADTEKSEILKSLVQHADVNFQSTRDIPEHGVSLGMTAAMCAAGRGYWRCLKDLFQAGADFTVQCRKGYTALICAASEEQADCVKYLTECLPSSELNHKDTSGMTALMWAAKDCSEKSLLCMQYLLAAGADVKIEDNDGRTALMVAAENNVSADYGVAAVNMLLEKGANINKWANNGLTPITHAIEKNESCSIAMKLFKKGADPTLSRRYRSCLHERIRNGNLQKVRALIMMGFPPLELKDDIHGNKAVESYLKTTPVSPLAVALLHKRPDIARYLIQNTFFTRFDVVQLCWDSQLHGLLEEIEGEESLDIIDFLSKKGQSLQNLCLIVVSSALSQDFVRDGAKRVFQPTFKDRVQSLKLPKIVKEALLHKTKSSSSSCQSWSSIILGE